MNRETIKELKNWFSVYVQSFKSLDTTVQRNIILKEEHSYAVCTEILNIGNKLGLRDDDLRLAEIIALFHDVGRFEQYARYHTYVDKDSVDHAELGVRILRDHHVLHGLDESTQGLILRTISYHNRATLPQEETQTCLFFTKLLRDADKLDIWRVVTDHYQQNVDQRNSSIELGLVDTPGISKGVYSDLMAERIVNSNNLKNLNDFKLLLVGLVYDINFVPTFQCVQEREYLNQIREALPKTKEVEKVIARANAYINKRIEST